MSTPRARPTALVAATLITLSCAKPAPSPPSTPHKKSTSSATPATRFVLEAHGVSGQIPAAWQLHKSEEGYRGSCSTPADKGDCVVLIQAQAVVSTGRAISPVLQIKNQLLDELKSVDPDGTLLRTAVYDHHGNTGLRMELRFSHDGQTWRKDLLLIQRGGSVLVLSLAASDKAFVAAMPAWTGLIDSLQFVPGPQK